jgi:hypothetical protein
MSGRNCKYFQCCSGNYRDASFLRADIQLGQGTRTGFQFMDKPSRYRSNIQRVASNNGDIQVQTYGYIRMRISR